MFKNNRTALWNFVKNSETSLIFLLFPQGTSTDTRVQLSSTDDQRQFITLRVHHCLEHVERDAQRRAVRMRRLRLRRAVVQQFTSCQLIQRVARSLCDI